MKSVLATSFSLIYLILVTSTLFNHPEIVNENATELTNGSNKLGFLYGNDIFLTNMVSPMPSNNFINGGSENILKNKIGLPLLDIPGSHNPDKKREITLVEKKTMQTNGTLETGKVTDSVNVTRRNTEETTYERLRRNIIMPAQVPNITIVNGGLSTILRSDSFLFEIFLDIFLLVLLVWFLNREFEISYRLSFHGNAVAAKDQSKVEFMKNQADWLLHNIIPRHVVDQLKMTARYSENVREAGILFASIVNFGEMYDESYMDGRECLRVLNELVADFDELLGQPEFSMVEKIKTIGSTFMAASGLNSSMRKGNSKEHLFQLMEFALTLQSAIYSFNADLLEFDLELRVGYNFGDVTAGVIGTTKLHYDIWGDPVNIASRMDSTGQPNKIQVPEHCVQVLSERYSFEHRGTIYVKGKDNMDVYLVSGRKGEK